MSISKRRGKLTISKEIYYSSDVDEALSKLEVKVFSIDYFPFIDSFEIYFTSKYIDEIDDSVEIPKYSIIKSPYGFTFKKGEN